MIQILIKGQGGWIEYANFDGNQVERAVDELDELKIEYPKLNWKIKLYA